MGYLDRIAAQERYLMALEEFGDRQKALAYAERSYSAIKVWRERYPEFKVREQAVVDTVAERTREQMTERFASDTDDEEVKYTDAGVPLWPHGFARFRKRFFKMDTPLFQREMVQSYEDAKPGDITMILVPPEHGKTTLFEDYASMKLATNPSYRMTVGSEKLGMAQKILRRVSGRMSPDGPFPQYAQYWGPMAPDDERSQRPQVWNQKHFDVSRKQSSDERDYSMQALGVGSAIAGTRCDHLHTDDITSLSNVRQTITEPDGIVPTYRQDWLSRPGETGKSTIAGTRVDEGDFYEVIEEAIGPDILQVIRKPAIVWDNALNDWVPLWPEKYTMENLERTRRKVGESAWARNYMQQPLASSQAVFDNMMLDAAKDELTNVFGTEPLMGQGDRFLCMCDPSIGGRNVWMVAKITDTLFTPVWVEVNSNLNNYDDIIAILQRLLRIYTGNGAVCAAVIIEAMAFQKGMLEDRRLIELQAQYGFEAIPHTTGRNKADPVIGVPAMPGSFRRGEISIPWGGEETQAMFEELTGELRRWRVAKRGTELVQDIVMAFWFGWMWWDQNRGHIIRIKDPISPLPPDRGLPSGMTRYPTPTKMPDFRRSA